MAKITGTLTALNGEINNAAIAADAAIDADKLQHCYKAGTGFGLPIGGTPVAREEIVFVANGPGRIRGFNALLADSGTATSIAFDLKKNGATVLSGTIAFTNSDADATVKTGTVVSASFTADDRLSIALTVSSATGAEGPYAWVDLEENTAP